MEDIIEELIGKFTTSTPTAVTKLAWETMNLFWRTGQSLRDLNRKLGANLPLDGPENIEWILLPEYLREIPETGFLGPDRQGPVRSHPDTGSNGTHGIFPPDRAVRLGTKAKCPTRLTGPEGYATSGSLARM